MDISNAAKGMTRISIIIPAHNEEDNIERVLASIPRIESTETDISVVDNGSTDATAKIAKSMGARVLREPRRGYGIATIRGIAEAKGDIIVTMDADGAHSGMDLPRIVRPVMEHPSVAALGVRIHSFPHGMNLRRFVGNSFLATVFRALYGTDLSDVQCGYRALHRRTLEKLRLTETGMQFTTELLIELREKSIPIIPVKIDQFPTTKSHVNDVTDFIDNLTLMSRRFGARRRQYITS